MVKQLAAMNVKLSDPVISISYPEYAHCRDDDMNHIVSTCTNGKSKNVVLFWGAHFQASTEKGH